jgi:cell division septation protein DedD
LSTDQQTVGNWFHWWLENVAGEDLEPNSYEQYRTILKSVNEKSAFTKLFLTDASSAGLYFFYRRELKKQLSSAWSKRIYRFARYALAAAARAGVAPNYPQGSDLFMIGHRFARALKVGFTTVSVLLVLLLIFAGVRVVRYNEDWLTAGATVARENGLGVVVAAVEDVYYGHIKVAAVGGTPTGGADFGGAPVDSASPSESPSETQSAVPSPTPSATSKPTHRPNPRPTPSESPSATPTETPSPSPSETPTETPTPTLVSFVG